MGGSELILYKKEGAIATLVLNLPDRLNAFHGDMRQLLADGLAKAEADNEVRGCWSSPAGDVPSARAATSTSSPR